MMRLSAAFSLALAGLAGCNEFGVGPGGADEVDSGLIDADGDGFFVDGDGFTTVDEDCDDNDPRVYPGAPEVCGDGRITDCLRTSEEGAVSVGPLAFQDLQAGLDGTPPGRELLVCPGTYIGNFTAPKPIRVRALEGPEVTILKGAEQGSSTLTVDGGTEVVGFTINDGNAPEGGGLKVLDGGTLLVDNCIIENNLAEEGGGIYGTPEAAIRVVGSQIRNNTALTQGGGVFVGTGGELVLDKGSKVEENTARTGGGVFVSSGRIEGGEITQNTATPATPSGEGLTINPPGGSGVAAFGKSTIINTEISTNECTGDAGGAVLVLEDHELTLDAVRIRSNRADSGGGGLQIAGGRVELVNGTEIASNASTAGRGGGVNILNGELRGGVVRDNTPGGGILVRNGLVAGVEVTNNSSRGEGGGIQARGEVTLQNVVLQGNQAFFSGGGVYYAQDQGSPDQLITMNNVLVGQNRATGGAGGGIYATAALLEGCSVSRNTADRGAGIFVERRLIMNGGSLDRNTARPVPSNDSGGAVMYVPPGKEAMPDVPMAFDRVDMGDAFGETDNEPNDITFFGRDGIVLYEAGREATFECSQTACGL